MKLDYGCAFGDGHKTHKAVENVTRNWGDFMINLSNLWWQICQNWLETSKTLVCGSESIWYSMKGFQLLFFE